MTAHAMENAVDNGVELHLNEAVTAIEENAADQTFIVTTSKNSYHCKIVINCAGVYADQMAAMVGQPDYSIRPRKGE